MRRNALVRSLLAATLSGGLACSSSVPGSAPGTGGGGSGAGVGDASGTGSGGTAGAGGTSGGAGSSAGAGTSGGSSGGGGAGGAAGVGGNSAPTCDPSCDAHQTCGLQGRTPTCNCVAGYEMTQAGSCVWGTVPADPGFQNMPAGAWTLAQGATINPTAAGDIDPGEADFSRTASCAGGGGVHQSISMPPLAESEPLALTLVTNADCITKQPPGSCWAMDVDAVINGGTMSYDEVSPYISHTGCLGERAYGGTFDLVIRPRSGQACYAIYKDAVVDHVDIAPSSKCPWPGTIPDADFDGALDTWKTWTGGNDGFTPVAEIAPGLGSVGSAAAHLSTPGSCEEAAAHEMISPPLSLPNLALQVRFKGPAGASARVFVDNVTMAVVTGTGAEVSSNVCLLESNKGMTQDLLLGLGVDGSLPSDVTTCAAVNQEFVFDDLKFVSDPSCPATTYLADGGFERTDPASAWDKALQSGGVLVATTGDTVGIDTTAANVHGGKRALKMVNSDGCAVRNAAFPATIPASLNGAGPALQFFYKAPALTKSKLTVTAPGLATSGNLPAVTDYTRAQICLDPTMSGQTVTVELTLAGNVEGVCAAQPTETAWFDDFAVTTSAGCPSE